MNDLTDEQLLYILGYYFFESKKSNSWAIEKFSDRLNSIFKCDINPQMIQYYCSMFRNIDPSYTAKPVKTEDARLSLLWNYYIVEDRVEILKKKFIDFRKGLVVIEPLIVEEEEIEEQLEKIIDTCQFTFVDDKPKEKYSDEVCSLKKTVRDLKVSFNALKIADFCCEVDNQHPLFLRKGSEKPYTEGHHIIPLKYQNQFKVNLDVEANIVSLCTNCHHILHYGQDFEAVLRKIFTSERKNRLHKCGIDITIDELIEMYR